MRKAILLTIFAIGSYFLGNINWALIISKIKKTDIRKLGSGNPGTLNMSRNLGLKAGLLTFFLDIIKGVLPTLIAFFVFRKQYFKGGKGIATTIGVFIVCQSVFGWEWAVILIMSLVAAVVFIYFTEFGAMGSFIAITPPAITSGIRLYLQYGWTLNSLTITYYVITNMLILAICFFTWFAHRRNIERMLAGDEHPTSIREMVVKAKAKKMMQKKNNTK